MDNLSEETKEKELVTQTPPPADGGDIRFEEIVEVDEIQKMLQLKLENEDSEIEFAPEIKELPKDAINVMTPEHNKDKENAKDIAPLLLEPNLNAKKYVIYVDADNVGFVESLDSDARRGVINKILREQNAIVKKAKIKAETKNYFQRALVVTFTFIIGFPIMFFCVNKAVEASMTNYEQAKQNFVKLYKQQGRIKQTDIDKSLGN